MMTGSDHSFARLRSARAARRLALASAVVGTALVLDAPRAMAQIVQSDIDAEPGGTETTQLVTSSTEVRRAVIGLLGVAALAGILFIVYWYVTGQQARERYARQFSGRHVAAGARVRRGTRRDAPVGGVEPRQPHAPAPQAYPTPVRAPMPTHQHPYPAQHHPYPAQHHPYPAQHHPQMRQPARIATPGTAPPADGLYPTSPRAMGPPATVNGHHAQTQTPAGHALYPTPPAPDRTRRA